jgi:carboxyl-terminal processing protease
LNLNDKQKKLLILGGFLLSFGFGLIVGHQDSQFSKFGFSPKLTGKYSQQTVEFGQFWKVWDLLEKKYDGKVDYQKMLDGAISGMAGSLGDPYTSYLTAEEAKQLENDLSGTVSGIGAEVGIKNNRITVISPIEGSPAKKAGILPGDIIAFINSESTENMDINTAVGKIRGQKGTKVKLTILRGNKLKEFTITRDTVSVKSVTHEIKNQNVGYLKISRFDDNTSSLVRDYLLEFKERGVKKLVIDLRDNPGGYLDSAVSVSSQFIKSGVIVSEKREDQTKKNDYRASGDGVFTDPNIKIIVLTNQGSASAAEILAGAIKDHNRGTLVGEKTFGKGSVQQIETLAGGAALRVTIAHWYTPNGKNIGKEGIAPNVEVKLTESDYNNDRDPQLNKALDMLK